MARPKEAAKSKVLQNDSLIYQLAEQIDSVKYYYSLGRDLLGSQAAVSNIIGRTEPDYREIVFRCLYMWRNANGTGAGSKLVQILKGVKLDKLAAHVEKELKRKPSCLKEDIFLQSLTSRIDCAAVYRKLGLALLDNNSVKLSNLIGPVTCSQSQYEDALFHVLIRWRNQAGSSLKSLEKLKKILSKHGLKDSVLTLNQMEYGSNDGPNDSASGYEPHSPPIFDSDMDTDGSSGTEPLSRQEFYDIYLVASSEETPYFRKMKDIIQRNGWTMQTSFDSKLGIPVLESIENAVLNCSHVVYIITKDDCDNEGDVNHTMTIEMAFQSLTDKGLEGRIIPIFCCDRSFLPLKLRALTSASIHDENLEEKMRRSIDVNIRREREKELRSVLELRKQTTIDEPLPLISSSSATGQ